MRNMKKWLAVFLLVVMAVTLTACSGGKKEEPKAEAPAAAPAAVFHSSGAAHAGRG